MKTYGTLTIVEGDEARSIVHRTKGRVWLIQGEPHVMTRIKRLFAKVDRASMGRVALSDTAENARELAWFMERYPLDVDPASHVYLERRAEEHRRRETLIHEIISGRYRAPTPRELAIPLREYQRQARDMVLATGALLIGDDVGLGKTASSIGVLVDPRTLPALVVTLTHLTTQWRDEIARFAPHLRVHIAKKGTAYDLTASKRSRRAAKSGQVVIADVEASAFPDVIVMNYAKLAGWSEALAPHVQAVIFDEVQELRHVGSDKYNAAEHVAAAAAFRVGLSATPFYNYGSEMHSVLNVLSPDCLGTREEFLREWCTNVRYEVDQATGKVKDKGLIANPAAFGTHLRNAGLMLRRTRAEVGREVPPISIIEQAVDADAAVLDNVATAAADLARIILAQGGVKNFDRMQAAGELDWKLRQATGIAKAPYVAEFVRLLVESGEKVVLFGWHHEVYRLWQERLRGFKPVMYTGTESTTQKDAAKKAFVDGDCPVLIMSLRAGAGLDGLQKVCRTVVFGEIDWSPGIHEQNIGRIARDGQTDPVAAYFLLAETGSDPVVWDVLGVKARQISGVRDPDAPLVESLQIDPARLKKLAAGFLKQRGERVPDAEAA
jgi:superfamily II DNA or RNA helicase